MKKPLKLHNVDLEARLGFTPGRFTNPNKSLGFCLAAVFTCTFFILLHTLPPQSNPLLQRTLDLFLDRGFIPYVTVFCFCWGAALIWLKSRKCGVQITSLRTLLTLNLFEGGINPTNAASIQEQLRKDIPEPSEFILTNRVSFALSNLENLQDPQHMSTTLNDLAQSDEVQVDESYGFIATFLYIIPVLGFIGTVLGLGSAIGQFGGAIASSTGDLSAILPSLRGVTSGLAVAFDTTLLALIAALLLQVYSTFIRARESSILEDCNFFLQQEFLTMLRK